jgi:mycofactocin precursor
MFPPEQAEETTTATADAVETATAAEAPLVEDELLVEDVSIDGMCGVY